MSVIVQKVQKIVSSDLQRAIKYYSLICTLNNLKLSPKQIELLSFVAVKGGIASPAARREFVNTFDSSLASMENIKHKLVKKGALVEIDKKYKVNPQIALDFSKDIVLQINLLSADGHRNR